MNFLAHLHLAHLADSSLSGNLLADFVRGNPATHYPPDVVEGIYMHRRIDVITDNLPEVREAREWFRHETRRVAPITLDVMWDHFLSRHWTQISPDFPLQAFVGYAHAQVATILPDSPPRFVNLNDYLWSEKWLERYRDMDFIQNVLNGMANRRPRLDALRDSWYDLDAHYDALEERFWHFYPRMMAHTGRPQSAVTA
ncbi:ACP phosphodiesterase [Salmonella enterica]|nr:ACP phosphodiesterase [Salmonella enterica]